MVIFDIMASHFHMSRWHNVALEQHKADLADLANLRQLCKLRMTEQPPKQQLGLDGKPLAGVLKSSLSTGPNGAAMDASKADPRTKAAKGAGLEAAQAVGEPVDGTKSSSREPDAVPDCGGTSVMAEAKSAADAGPVHYSVTGPGPAAHAHGPAQLSDDFDAMARFDSISLEDLAPTTARVATWPSPLAAASESGPAASGPRAALGQDPAAGQPREPRSSFTPIADLQHVTDIFGRGQPGLASSIRSFGSASPAPSKVPSARESPDRGTVPVDSRGAALEGTGAQLAVAPRAQAGGLSTSHHKFPGGAAVQSGSAGLPLRGAQASAPAAAQIADGRSSPALPAAPAAPPAAQLRPAVKLAGHLEGQLAPSLPAGSAAAAVRKRVSISLPEGATRPTQVRVAKRSWEATQEAAADADAEGASPGKSVSFQSPHFHPSASHHHEQQTVWEELQVGRWWLQTQNSSAGRLQRLAWATSGPGCANSGSSVNSMMSCHAGCVACCQQKALPAWLMLQGQQAVATHAVSESLLACYCSPSKQLS